MKNKAKLEKRIKQLEYIARSFIEFAENVEDYDGANDPSLAVDLAKKLIPDWNKHEMPLEV